MDRLAEVVRQEVEKYGVRSLNRRVYKLSDHERQSYVVISIGFDQKVHPAHPVVMARVEGDQVIIEADNTDNSLVEALMQAGVPREKIILAYMDEPLPQPSP